MSALKLTQPVDFVALRSAASLPRPTFHQVDAAGVPCASASDPRLCLAELARASLLETSGGASHLALTRGDTVQVLQSLEQKLSLLGSMIGRLRGEIAKLEVLDHYIRIAKQLVDQRPPRWRAKVRGDRALVAVGGVKIGRVPRAVRVLDERRAPAAGVVAFRAFDLDHFGAEIGQHLPRPRTREDAG